MTDVGMFDKIDDPQDRQIGGRHYKGYAISPYDFISQNKLNFLVLM